MAELDGHLFLGYGDFLVRTLYRSLDPLLRYSTRIGLEPVHYSYANLGAGVLGAALIAGGRLQAGACLVALSGVADVVDGRLARATGRASTRGDFIDSTFD